MFETLIKIFIKDYDNVGNQEVRSRYGTLASIMSIILNGILVIFKIMFGLITNSVSIMADGFNNLSDMGSNLATLFGFKLAKRKADKEHPYGHGRIEYIVGMIISFLIIYVGFTSLIDSITKLFNPEKVTFSIGAIIVLAFSILIKLYMSYFNKKCALKINSEALMAASQDSKNDVLSTSATMVSMLLILVTDLPVDSIIGILVSILVIKSGIEIFFSTMNPLLGEMPSAELVKEINDYIMSYPVAIGIHDLMIHDYGPGRRFMTLHVEVDCHDDIMSIHDEIDNLEKDLYKKFDIFTTIHMDPIDTRDEVVNEMRQVIKKIVKDIDINYDIHDFRMVSGPTHTNLIFDVLIPINETKDYKLIKEEIEKRVSEYNPNYYCVIEVEHSYV